MAEDIPKRKMPKFKISEDEADELKTISAITGLLAEKPQVASDIADIFIEVEMEKEQELTRRISAKLSENLKELPTEKISASFGSWSPVFFRYVYTVRYGYIPPRYWCPSPYRYGISPDRYKDPAQE